MQRSKRGVKDYVLLTIGAILMFVLMLLPLIYSDQIGISRKYINLILLFVGTEVGFLGFAFDYARGKSIKIKITLFVIGGTVLLLGISLLTIMDFLEYIVFPSTFSVNFVYFIGTFMIAALLMDFFARKYLCKKKRE